MAGNSFGSLFRISTFGESHGKGIGVVIDGCPAGLEIDMDFIQSEMDRRKPGQSVITTSRKESDKIQLLSGVFEGKSLGTPMALFIPNEDQQSADYESLKNVYRPSHADRTYDLKYGIRDYRGGGRSSARETAARVAAGAIAKMLLKREGVFIHAFVEQVGEIKIPRNESIEFSEIENSIVRCPHKKTAEQMIHLIEEVKAAGDTIGGVIQCVIQNCPAGLGEPVFDKLHADLAKAMLSINAVKGFEYGEGFAAAAMRGSEHNDRPTENIHHAGGIVGGISNGQEISFRVAFKPVATILQEQKTFDKQNNEVKFKASGRHDPCVLPRAVPIVEAMAAIVLADHYLRNKVSRV